MTLLEDYVVDRFDLSPEWISKRAQNAQLSTVTQNRPLFGSKNSPVRPNNCEPGLQWLQRFEKQQTADPLVCRCTLERWGRYFRASQE